MRNTQIKYIKLSNGEDIIAKINVNELMSGFVTVTKPLKVLFYRDPDTLNVQFTKWSAGISEETKPIINTEHIIAVFDPVPEYISLYNTMIKQERGLDTFRAQNVHERLEAIEELNRLLGEDEEEVTLQ